jgi:nitrite reductase/ring-hydroxylating ferredoxin subunit
MTRGQQPADPEQQRQHLVGFRTNDEWAALVDHANDLIADVEAHPDEATRKQVLELLQAVDALHREAITRLVRLFKEGVLEQVVTDPAIHTLMDMYDLLPRAPACAKIYDFLSAAEAPEERGKITGRRIRERVPIPHWVPAPTPAADLGRDEVALLTLDGRDVLLARAEGSVFALAGRCLCDGRRMEDAARHGYTLRCPGPNGCLFDLRSGARLGQGGELQGFPTQVDAEGRALVGFDLPFVPNLPAF